MTFDITKDPVALEAAARKLCELRGLDPYQIVDAEPFDTFSTYHEAFNAHISIKWNRWSTYLWVQTTLEIIDFHNVREAITYGTQVSYNQVLEESAPAPF